jgi:Lrp/AsnC family transcriptional regulator for asnA, asnC and gidA
MEDARKPILQIANKIGISGAAIHQRLRKLEQSGVISGSKFIVNNKILGYNTMAFVGVYLDKASRTRSCERPQKNTRSARVSLHHRKLVDTNKNNMR